MNGPWIMVKDAPRFLYRETWPLLWPLLIPLMTFFIIWMFLVTPMMDWNKREDDQT
jgi:hypothetical protein